MGTSNPAALTGLRTIFPPSPGVKVHTMAKAMVTSGTTSNPNDHCCSQDFKYRVHRDLVIAVQSLQIST